MRRRIAGERAVKVAALRRYANYPMRVMTGVQQGSTDEMAFKIRQSLKTSIWGGA